MKKQFLITTLCLLVASFSSIAQFGPPSGGGDMNGRPRPASQGQKPNILESNLPKGNSKITGFVIDSAVTTAVEYANIALISKITNKPVDGTMADEKGKFSLTRVAVGDYKITISFIGFADKTLDNIKVEKGKDIDLGVIKMSQSSTMLNEVTVTGEKSMIEEKVDRLVYNAEKDLTSKGGDAADVLKKVPMLSVDLDGNVSLRGTSNIKVLINNKPSTIVASSVADALKMIPADLIKSVEVITSPSAKYDAEGSGGIINIITKKSNLQGLNLNVDSGVGLRGSNLSLNGNYRQGKLGVSLGGFGRAFYNKTDTELDQTTNRLVDIEGVTKAVSSRTTQTAKASDNGLFGRYNLGFDYDLAKNQSLTASVAFGTRNFTRSQDLISNLYSGSTLNATTYRDVTNKDISNSVDMNLDYIKIFKPGQEWSISTQYSQNNLKNNFNASNLSSLSELLSGQKNNNTNFNKEITLQTDYVTPIKTNQQFEVGLKAVMRQVDSDYEYFFAGTDGVFISDATNPAGLLNYSQNIAAGYVSYMYSTKNKITFKVGTRYERTMIDAEEKKGDNALAKINIPSYNNIVPSINISKKLKNSTIKVAYNNRIQRPGLQQLNPNVNNANPLNISQGNPNLKPEISNNVELSLSTSIKKSYLTFALFGRQTNNSISRISSPDSLMTNVIRTTFQNIGKEQALGMNFFGNIFLTPKWTLNGGFDVYYAYLEGLQTGLDGLSKKVSNNGVVLSGRMMTQVSLKNGWAVQAFGGGRGRNVQLQGSMSGMRMYSVGVRKDFKNKKGSLGLAAENFVGGMRMVTDLNSPLLTQTFTNHMHNQNVKLTFSYKIGNMRMVEQKKTKSVKNDDVKSGGENN